jgi:adenylate cyclase
VHDLAARALLPATKTLLPATRTFLTATNAFLAAAGKTWPSHVDNHSGEGNRTLLALSARFAPGCARRLLARTGDLVFASSWAGSGRRRVPIVRTRLGPALGGLAVALAVALAFGGARLGRLPELGLERLERATADLRFRLRGSRPTSPLIALVAFDDRTVTEAPELFQRRAGWAQLLRALEELGPEQVGIDALFTDPEHLLAPDLEAAIRAQLALAPDAGTPESALLARVGEELGGDGALEQALAELGTATLIMHAGDTGAASPTADPSWSRGRYGQVVQGGLAPRPAANVLASLPRFNARAAALGLATVYEDDTNTVRAVELGREHGGGLYAPLALQLLRRHLGVDRGQLAWLGPEEAVTVGPRRFALEGDRSLYLNFRGPADSFPTYSAIDVARGRVPSEALRGKIVLVGLSHLGHDRVRTPFSPSVPGFEVQATFLDNLLAGDPLRRAPWWADAAIPLALGLLVALAFFLVGSPGNQVITSLGVLGSYLAAATWLFAARDRWVPVAGPVASVLGATLACLALSYLGEGRQRRWLRRSFARYLGNELIDELVQDPSRLRLGGERRTLTVLFSDIRDFTTLSERLDPEQLVSFLNTYLTPMTQAVLAEQGLLDKYIGDAVMAVFGAPLPRVQHADQGLRTVLRMHEALAELTPLLAQQGLELKIGIGINTGEMVVGNMGSAERFDYTVVGDAVNLASRLEGLTKVYGAFCLVGEATVRAAGPGFRFREVDRVQVKGKREPVAIHELLGGPGRELARYAEPQAFEAALADYRAGRWAQARTAFAACAARDPGDKVAALYVQRLAELGEQAPDGWTGTHAFHTK